MSTKYIVLRESSYDNWVGSFTTLIDAKRMLKIETETFYIFEYIY